MARKKRSSLSKEAPRFQEEFTSSHEESTQLFLHNSLLCCQDGDKQSTDCVLEDLQPQNVNWGWDPNLPPHILPAAGLGQGQGWYKLLPERAGFVNLSHPPLHRHIPALPSSALDALWKDQAWQVVWTHKDNKAGKRSQSGMLQDATTP